MYHFNRFYYNKTFTNHTNTYENILSNMDEISSIFAGDTTGVDKHIRSKMRNLNVGNQIMFNDFSEEIYEIFFYLNPEPEHGVFLVNPKNYKDYKNAGICSGCKVSKIPHKHLISPDYYETLKFRESEDMPTQLTDEVNSYVEYKKLCVFTDGKTSFKLNRDIKKYALTYLFKKYLDYLGKEELLYVSVIKSIREIGCDIDEHSEKLLNFLNNIESKSLTSLRPVPPPQQLTYEEQIEGKLREIQLLESSYPKILYVIEKLNEFVDHELQSPRDIVLNEFKKFLETLDGNMSSICVTDKQWQDYFMATDIQEKLNGIRHVTTYDSIHKLRRFMTTNLLNDLNSVVERGYGVQYYFQLQNELNELRAIKA